MDDFEETGADAADEVPKQCSALRKNGHVMIRGHPCKIVEMSTSKTGKHGHAKVHLVGIDIFDGGKFEENTPSTHNVSVPKVERTEYQVNSITSDGYLELMADSGEIREDLKLEGTQTNKAEYDRLFEECEKAKRTNKPPEELEPFSVQVLKCGKREKIIDVKTKKGD